MIMFRQSALFHKMQGYIITTGGPKPNFPIKISDLIESHNREIHPDVLSKLSEMKLPDELINVYRHAESVDCTVKIASPIPDPDYHMPMFDYVGFSNAKNLKLHRNLFIDVARKYKGQGINLYMYWWPDVRLYSLHLCDPSEHEHNCFDRPKLDQMYQFDKVLALMVSNKTEWDKFH